jgi:hypothetical protein
VAQSQLQLEKDRTLEIQRRYFAVCRELAVHAGVSSSAPTGEAVTVAEAVIDGDVKIEEKPTEGGEASGEGKKKRRRRRRRKIAGEPSEAGEGDDAEGDDGDDVEASSEGAPVDEGGNDSGAAAQA